MTQPGPETRRFIVHARHLDRHHSRILEEASFEAAAIAFVEDFQVSLGEDNEISVVVRELGTDHETCFKIDLDTGQAAPCG